MTKYIYCLIVNHNGRKYLKDCLSSLSKIKCNNYKLKVVVIDNASMDNSIKYIAKKFPKFKIITFHRNKGFTGAVNYGFKYVLKRKSKYVLLLNNDTKVKSNFLNHLISFADKNSDAGILSPIIYEDSKNKKIWFAGGKLEPLRFSSQHLSFENNVVSIKKPYESEYLSGCCMLIKRKVIEKVGLFDNRFFLYYEDVDYCLRAKIEGYKNYIIPKSKIIHLRNKTTIDNAYQEYYLSRNHLLILQKMAPFKIKVREYLRTIKTIYEKLKIQKDDTKAHYALMGIKDYLLGRFGKREHWY